MRQVLRRALPAASRVMLLAGCATEVVVGQASPGPGEPVDVAADEFPITGRQRRARSTSSPATRSPTSRPSGGGLPGVLRRGVHAAGGRLLLASTPRTSTRAPTPRPASAARARPPRRTPSPATPSTTPACDLDRLRPGAARGARRRVRPLPRAGGHGPRVRPRHAGPVRLLRARHPGRDPGRLPRRRLDRLGRRRRGRARRRSGRPSSTTSSAASCCCATTSAATRTTPRRTAPTSTASRPSTRASTAAWRPAATTSAPTGCSPRPRSTPRRVRQRGNAPFEDIVDWISDDPAGVLGRGLPVRVRHGLRAAGGGGVRRARAPDCAGLEDRDLGYCADDDTVYFDETDLATPAYDEIGDFALATAISLPYSLAVRDQAGLSTDDGAATRSAVCLTGWYAAQWYNRAFDESDRRRDQPRRHRRGRAVPARPTASTPRSSRTSTPRGSSSSAPSAPASSRAGTPASSER